MRSNVFVREDSNAAISSIVLTATATCNGQSPHDAAFRRGFAVALAAVATSLYIAPSEIHGRLQAANNYTLDVC